MIGLLTAVTILYAFLLVVVIAAGLITIGLALWSTGTNVIRIAEGLKVVERQTAPLGGHVTALNDGLTSVSIGLRSVAGHLSSADDELAMALGEPVAGAPANRVA